MTSGIVPWVQFRLCRARLGYRRESWVRRQAKRALTLGGEVLTGTAPATIHGPSARPPQWLTRTVGQNSLSNTMFPSGDRLIASQRLRFMVGVPGQAPGSEDDGNIGIRSGVS